MPSEPGAGAEAVVVACLRGNQALCNSIPKSLFEMFGSMLNQQVAFPLLDNICS